MQYTKISKQPHKLLRKPVHSKYFNFPKITDHENEYENEYEYENDISVYIHMYVTTIAPSNSFDENMTTN